MRVSSIELYILAVNMMCLATVIGASRQTDTGDLIKGPPRHKRLKRRSSPTSNFSNFTELINSMLDSERYDMQLRPGFGGPPTEIDVNINVRSMGPISEVESMFQMDCYFRQYWYDKRLSFSREVYNNSMLLSTHVLKKMWSPDTYITNGRKSTLHTITVPNMYIRIDPDGRVSFSQRLTIKTLCPMSLRKYPLDSQTCTVTIGSFGYKREDVQFRWKTGDNQSVVRTEDIAMSQFHLEYITVKAYNHSRMKDANDMASILETTFILKRETGYYLLNIYIPCGMLVALSWVTFWLNREASAARVSLGILTFLTTITIGMSERSGLAKVEYITALDLYMLLTMGYVLAAFFEYAGVNYFTKISKPDDCKPIYSFKPEELLPPPPPPQRRMKKRNCLVKFFLCFIGHVGYRLKLKAHKNDMNSVSKIDLVSRFLFPFTFFVLNILYYLAYVHIDIY
ncbi:gamma-aminobutyric acid receptor subunit alpha-5-like [Watersipora subatra]|uniref:gamma-aminobutyric acid receptor subunit alpha-5-like n=1 Tax=Watersipora subatra TaxID=2589382 RepID=UPI00355B9DA8